MKKKKRNRHVDDALESIIRAEKIGQFHVLDKKFPGGFLTISGAESSDAFRQIGLKAKKNK